VERAEASVEGKAAVPERRAGEKEQYDKEKWRYRGLSGNNALTFFHL